MKKLLCALLSAVLLSASLLSACRSGTENSEVPSADSAGSTAASKDESTSTDSGEENEVVRFPNGAYTYTDYLAVLPENWNPLTCEKDAYPLQFLQIGFYSALYNDDLHPVAGVEPYAGCYFLPELAAAEPVDVTEQIRRSYPEFAIPSGATAGYAYTIALNTAATWDDKTPITADDYVYSMQQLLDPAQQNARAADYFADGVLPIAGAKQYAKQGITEPTDVAALMELGGIESIEAFLERYGERDAYINWNATFGGRYDARKGVWREAADALEDTGMTVQELYDFFVSIGAQQQNSTERKMRGRFLTEVFLLYSYPDEVDFGTVGCIRRSDYALTLVFSKPLTGVELHAALQNCWLVKRDLYESCKQFDEDDGTFSTAYGTSAELTASYGPYRMVSGTVGCLTFAKNQNWYGYTDERHLYVDPSDGKTYPMYQTTRISCRAISSTAAQDRQFRQGELAMLRLDNVELARRYRESEYAHSVPSGELFFLIVNGNRAAIASRELAEDFDQSAFDLETLTLESFRKALALSFNNEAFCSAVSPLRTGAFGLFGDGVLFDRERMLTYRSTDAAKRVLCDFYGIDPNAYETLDDALAAVSGCVFEQAQALYAQAFSEALAAGYISDANRDGRSDQTVRLLYNCETFNEQAEQTVTELNRQLTEILIGTPFENRVVVELSGPWGNEWVQKVQDGSTDLVLSGWTGAEKDPFGFLQVFFDPDLQYDAAWFDPSACKFELTVGGETLNGSVADWGYALAGVPSVFTTADGKQVTRSFGEGEAESSDRLAILATFEMAILSRYNYIPMEQSRETFLLSPRLYLVTEDYCPYVGYGGLAYLRYNTNDEEWAELLASRGSNILNGEKFER